MRLLLDAGCDVNAIYTGGNGSALHEAISQSVLHIVKGLLDRGADVNLRAGKDGTPLKYAALNGDEEIYRLVLSKGADIDPNPPYGYYGTPLQAAIQKKYYHIVHELLELDASAIIPSHNTSLLTSACGNGKDGQLDLIKRLISLGVSLDAVHRPEDDAYIWKRIYLTPLQSAVHTGNETIVSYLIVEGAQINPPFPQGTYGYPLEIACVQANESLVRLLLQHGANVNAVGGEYDTALQTAFCKRSDAIQEILIEAGADVTLEDGKYGSLQAAVLHDRKYVKILLEAGANPNLGGGVFGTPLRAAREKRLWWVEKMLLDAGGRDDNL